VPVYTPAFPVLDWAASMTWFVPGTFQISEMPWAIIVNGYGEVVKFVLLDER
jgi:hypothetical protein